MTTLTGNPLILSTVEVWQSVLYLHPTGRKMGNIVPSEGEEERWRRLEEERIMGEVEREEEEMADIRV